jgi:hypothetical protein
MKQIIFAYPKNYMYQSNKRISRKNKQILTEDLKVFLKNNKKTYCKALKRTVDLSKLPEAITKRKTSATARLQKFWIAIEILKKSKNCKTRELKGCIEYEIIGLDTNKTKIAVHLREELSIQKNRVLFFVSCY